MKDKILILGGSGMLGWKVTEVLSKINPNITVTVSKSQSKKSLKKKINKKLNIIYLDVLNLKKKNLKKIALKHKTIINCIGLIKPHIDDFESKDIAKAIKINSEFPNILNEITKGSKIKIFQIATDCVFSGKSKLYKENSKHDCEDVYGKTKSLGEINSKNFFNIRCSIIGEELKNHKSLISWFLSNKNGSKVNGFTDHEWNGVTTEAFAEAIKAIIINKIKLPNLIHIVPKNKVSKFKLLKILNEKYKKNFKVRKFVSGFSINRTLGTNNKNLNSVIWQKSKFKSIPTIERMIKDI